MSDCDAAESASPCLKGEEIQLIKRAQRRDGAALRRLIELHQERLFAFVWRMVRNHHDAEEICQEAFLKAFAALDTFDIRYRFSTWLFTIAYRLTLNVLRRKRPLAADIDFARVAAADAEGVEERSANTEEAQRLKTLVWSAVERLTPPQRAAVLLFYRQQVGCNEIAEVLDIPVATVKSLLHRARAKLKDLLEPQLSEEYTRDRILRGFAG